jgi:hypothetical protein
MGMLSQCLTSLQRLVVALSIRDGVLACLPEALRLFLIGASFGLSTGQPVRRHVHVVIDWLRCAEC